jgi:hypothetical protein
MSLEKIIAQATYPDQALLRQYTKIAKKWEEKGKDKYVLCSWLNSAWLFGVGSFGMYAHGTLTSIVAGSDLADNLVGLRFGKHGTGIRLDGDKKIIESKAMYSLHMLKSICRTPVWFFGVYCVAVGAHDVYNTWAYDEAALTDGLKHLALGISHVGIASSIFIKNADTEILEKKPLWQKALDWVRTGYRNLVPDPSLHPAPVPLQYSCVVPSKEIG